MKRFDEYLEMAWTVAGTVLWVSAIWLVIVGEYTHSIALMLFVIAADKGRR